MATMVRAGRSIARPLGAGDGGFCGARGEVGGEGRTGYIADFTFATAYKFYEFGASSFAMQMGNPDQELSAVGNLAPIPEPETYAMLIAGLSAVGFMARRRKRTPGFNGAAASQRRIRDHIVSTRTSPPSEAQSSMLY